jgi:hypothetical protein
LIKKTFLLLISLFFMGACTPKASPQATAEVRYPIPTAPEATISFEGCSFWVSYPPEFALEELGFGAMLQPPSEEAVRVHISARRRLEAEQDLSIDALATRLSTELAPGASPPEFEPVTVIDGLGQALSGLQGDIVADGQHIRLLVVVRPKTLLGDMLPDDVIYEVVAQSPDTDWHEWISRFDVIIQTLHPRDCGGV